MKSPPNNVLAPVCAIFSAEGYSQGISAAPSSLSIWSSSDRENPAPTIIALGAIVLSPKALVPSFEEGLMVSPRRRPGSSEETVEGLWKTWETVFCQTAAVGIIGGSNRTVVFWSHDFSEVRGHAWVLAAEGDRNGHFEVEFSRGRAKGA